MRENTLVIPSIAPEGERNISPARTAMAKGCTNSHPYSPPFSRLPMLASRIGVFKSVSAVLLSTFVIVSCSHAEPALDAKFIGEFGDLPVTAEKICTKEENRDVARRYDAELDRIEVGGVGGYDVTSHTVYLGVASDGDVLITLSFLPRDQNTPCYYLVVIPSLGRHPKIKSSFGEGYDRLLTPEERDVLREMWQICSRDPSPERFFPKGDYLRLQTENGKEITKTEGFDCASAVPNNIASIDVESGERAVRISVLWDKLFIVRTPK